MEGSVACRGQSCSTNLIFHAVASRSEGWFIEKAIPYQPYWVFSYTECGSDAVLQHYNAFLSSEIKKKIISLYMQCKGLKRQKRVRDVLFFRSDKWMTVRFSHSRFCAAFPGPHSLSTLPLPWDFHAKLDKSVFLPLLKH